MDGWNIGIRWFPGPGLFSGVILVSGVVYIKSLTSYFLCGVIPSKSHRSEIESQKSQVTIFTPKPAPGVNPAARSCLFVSHWFGLTCWNPFQPPKKTRCVQHLRLALLFWLSSIPKHSMYGIVTIYFPTWMVNFYGACRKTYHTLSVWDNVLEKRPPSCIFASDHASQV